MRGARRVRSALRWLLGALLVALTAWLLSRQVHVLSWSALAAAWRATPPSAIALALGWVTSSFACLGLYEVFAARSSAPGRVSARDAFAIGLVAHALSNTLGFHLLTGTAFRLRAYRRHGLAPREVGALLARVGAYVALGVVLVALPALLVSPAWRGPTTMVLSLALLAGVALSPRHAGENGWLVRVRLRMRGLAPMLPVAAVEMLGMMAALWVLLPAALQPAPASFALLFVAAMLAGIVAHAPGGIGVFEATLLTAAPAGHGSELLAALLLYRALYNLLPFALAVLAAPFVLAAGAPAEGDAVGQFEGG